MAMQAIPVLRIFDETKAREFYLDYLGMSLDWEHRFEDNTPIYMQVSWGEFKLHLSEHVADCSPGAKVFVATDELDAIFKPLKEKNYKYLRPQIEQASWGTRTLTLIDPFSNQIMFNEETKDSP